MPQCLLLKGLALWYSGNSHASYASLLKVWWSSMPAESALSWLLNMNVIIFFMYEHNVRSIYYLHHLSF